MAATEYGRVERFAVADRSLRLVFDRYPWNHELHEVITKVALVDSLRSTKLFEVFKMATHIWDHKEVDAFIQRGDPRAVEVIRHGHGIRVKKSGNEKDLYSFATKYLSFHAPRAFPAVDAQNRKLLVDWNAQYGFTEEFGFVDLVDYPLFLKVMKALREHGELAGMSPKWLEQGMRLYAHLAYDPGGEWELARPAIQAAAKEAGFALPWKPGKAAAPGKAAGQEG